MEVAILFLSFLSILPKARLETKLTTTKLKGHEGTITSANFPNSYPKKENHAWVITVPVGFYIRLTFEKFDVEPYEDCKTDVLEIKDGSDKYSPLIGILTDKSEDIRIKGGQYCNARRPPDVLTSSSNSIRLWFRTDSTIQNTGFKVAYKAMRDIGCGGDIIASNGEVTSPRFPLHYPKQRKCQWNIKVPDGKFVFLKFEFFEVETKCSFHECQCLDWVQIVDRNVIGSQEIGKYCFIAPPPMVSSGNELSIIFNSDDFGRLQGFKAIFAQSKTKGCGADLISKNGTIELPTPDGTYDNLMQCIWTITAQKNEYISLKFQYMDVLASRKKDCSADYIEIRNGPDEESPLLGRYCNLYAPDMLVSTGTKMFISFSSDDIKVGNGFSITYQTHTKSCSSSLGMEDGRINKYRLQTSSVFKIAHEPHQLNANYGRLNGPYAWCSQEQRSKGVNEAEYYQINFKKFTKITKVATQGYTMVGNLYFVTKYKLRYLMGDKKFHPYATLEDSKRGNLNTLFNGNRVWNVSKENKLTPAIVAKSLRIIPLEYESGRRPHICLRLEVYGCRIPSDTAILTKPESTIKFISQKKSSKTWLISVAGKNSVYLFKVVRAGTNCDTSELSQSYDGATFNKVKNHCKEQEVQIHPSTRQLWVKFDIKKETKKPQLIEFKYSLQNLGHGRVVKSPHGTITCLHNEAAKLNESSVWLFVFPDSYKIDIKFERVRLPTAEKENPSITVKRGLDESSATVRKLVGKQPRWAFVQSKNTLRIEYHVGQMNNGRPPISRYRDGFKLKYQAWAVETKEKT